MNTQNDINDTKTMSLCEEYKTEKSNVETYNQCDTCKSLEHLISYPVGFSSTEL